MVAAFGQAVSQFLNDYAGNLQVEDMFSGLAGQPVGSCPAPKVVAGRDGTESPGVVVEAGQVVKTCRFHHRVQVTLHATQWAVKEPPGRPEFDGRIMAGQRSQFPGIAGLIQGEENQREVF